MPMKQTGRKVHRSMQGKQVDMDMLRKKNELTPAVTGGTARVNARGDELGAGGKIIRKREDVMRDNYNNQVNTVPDEVTPRTAKVVEEDDWVEPAPVVAPKKTTTRKKTAAKAVAPTWTEDDDGNFTQAD
jgi:hypothetical protein